jgi:hypothetical protein
MDGVKAAGSEMFRQTLAPTIGAVRDLADAVSERPNRFDELHEDVSRASNGSSLTARSGCRE